MNFREESDRERLIRFMNIPPQKKLEWLQEMRNFLCKAWTKKQRQAYFKMRQVG
jgi:hypothetical protein